jgi:hypothetical protein
VREHAPPGIGNREAWDDSIREVAAFFREYL